jgi:hypothetical protein
MSKNKPLADKVLEERAKSLFDISKEPEEWAARFAHTLGCSSFDSYTYRDKKLEKWIYTLHKILSLNSKIKLEELRVKYLTEDEIKRIEKQENLDSL